MGGCFSSPTTGHHVNVRRMLKKPRKIRLRRSAKKKRRSIHTAAAASPSVAGSAEEVWFEPVSLFGSDSDEEEYQTVPDDALSLTSYDEEHSSEVQNIHQHQALSNGYDVDLDSDSSWVKDTPHKCFPCVITSTKTSTLNPTSKVVSGHLCKTTDGDTNASLFSPRMIQKRPVAGSQVPICPIGKEMFDSWSPIEPSTFRVRGMNYLRDKKKEHASNNAAYYPFGVDIYLSRRKINHIARLVKLPVIRSNPKLPALLIVNVQIPLYPPTMFQNENDGEGMNVIMYFKLSERFEKEVPFHFQESIRKLINNEVEKIKGFHKETLVPFRERLKILSRVSNVDVLQLNAPQRKLMHAYNEKPILSRPQHEFHLGENYFEIDIDMHRFSYISRKGFDAFQDKLKICILDVGLTIQGNKVEELPEQVLCCLRVNGIDHTNYQQLELCEDIGICGKEDILSISFHVIANSGATSSPSQLTPRHHVSNLTITIWPRPSSSIEQSPSSSSAARPPSSAAPPLSSPTLQSSMSSATNRQCRVFVVNP